MKAAIDLLGAGVKIAQEGYEVAAPFVQQGVDAVAPVVSEAVKVTTETAGPLLQRATPVVKVGALQPEAVCGSLLIVSALSGSGLAAVDWLVSDICSSCSGSVNQHFWVNAALCDICGITYSSQMSDLCSAGLPEQCFHCNGCGC